VVAGADARYLDCMSAEASRLIAELYALPPKDFTRARNAKAAALKAAGHPADAHAIRELRRPPITLWAVNQLAHADPERLATFIGSVEQIRLTQLRDPRAASDAVPRQRAELDALVRRAVDLLADQGHRASPAAQRLISDTLLGAAADRDRARELRAGHLTQELPAPGFEVLTGAPRGGHLRLVPPSVREARSGKAERQAKAEQENERRRRDAEDRKRQAAEQQSVVAGLEREAEELARKLIAARERVREAQRESKARRRPRARPGE
jgi:hypothetical protein